MPDPITAIANATMHLYADLVHAALPNSPYAAAAETLSEDRRLEIAIREIRAGLKRLLSDDAEEVLAELEGLTPGFGQLAASSRLLSIAQGAITAIIAEARE